MAVAEDKIPSLDELCRQLNKNKGAPILGPYKGFLGLLNDHTMTNNPLVAALQKHVLKMNPPAEELGNFGPATEKKVVELKKQYGIKDYNDPTVNAEFAQKVIAPILATNAIANGTSVAQSTTSPPDCITAPAASTPRRSACVAR